MGLFVKVGAVGRENRGRGGSGLVGGRRGNWGLGGNGALAVHAGRVRVAHLVHGGGGFPKATIPVDAARLLLF